MKIFSAFSIFWKIKLRLSNPKKPMPSRSDQTRPDPVPQRSNPSRPNPDRISVRDPNPDGIGIGIGAKIGIGTAPPDSTRRDCTKQLSLLDFISMIHHHVFSHYLVSRNNSKKLHSINLFNQIVLRDLVRRETTLLFQKLVKVFQSNDYEIVQMHVWE